MGAPEFLTWDGESSSGTLPRRPSTEDCGGDNKLDDSEFPPDEVEHPTAAGWNQKVKQTVALAQVSAACRLEVRFNAGTPYVARSPAPSKTVEPSIFTVTDNGLGDTTVSWDGGTFPSHVSSPSGLTLLSSSTSPVTGHVQELTNGVRVRTFVNGAAADVTWLLDIN